VSSWSYTLGACIFTTCCRRDPGLDIVLTFTSAYTCYFVSEELLGASGLLAVVVMGFSMSLIGGWWMCQGWWVVYVEQAAEEVIGADREGVWPRCSYCMLQPHVAVPAASNRPLTLGWHV
jgi:hypothetical protein